MLIEPGQPFAGLEILLRTAGGIAAYRQRGHIAETPHGHIKHNMGLRQLSVRGKPKTSTEWTFACAIYNLFKAITTGHLTPPGPHRAGQVTRPPALGSALAGAGPATPPRVRRQNQFRNSPLSMMVVPGRLVYPASEGRRVASRVPRTDKISIRPSNGGSGCRSVLQPEHSGSAGSGFGKLLAWAAWSAHRRAVRLQDLARFPGEDRDCLGLGARLAACDRRLVMGDALTITVRRERGVVIAAVTGDIDISTVTRLRERLFELAGNGGR